MNLTKARVLVTGGAGLIGSHMVDALVAKGANVVILDNLEPQTHPHGKPSWINPNAEFIHGDVRNIDDWRRALVGVEYVFHQAAFGGFAPALSTYMDSNATGTTRLFEAIQKDKLPIKKIVAASSQAVYGEGTYYSEQFGIVYPQQLRSLQQLQQGQWELLDAANQPMKPLPTKEDKPLYTETIYGISKLAEEKLILGLGRKMGIPSVALRYAVTYGPRQSIFNPYTGVVSIFSTQILNDRSPVVYEDGEQTRDYLYVADNVNANLLVMEDARADYRVFNVGTGIATSVKTLAKELAAQYQKPEKIAQLTREYRPGDVRHFVHDSSALNQLGFKPSYSLAQGLEKYVAWIRTQPNVEEYFGTARATMRDAGIVFALES